MNAGRYRLDVGLLSACWALAITGNILLVNISSLVGYELAADKSLATLPAAMLWIGTAAATVPASFLMRRIGRRAGFMIGALIGLSGTALAAHAAALGSFMLLCLGILLMGAQNGFAYYYRFTAAEVAPDAFRSRAISLVMAGGVVAAVLGPTLARWSTGLFASSAYIGPFVAVGGLLATIFILVAFIDAPRPAAQALRGGRPLGQIMRQPAFAVAALAGAVAYGVMILVMSVSPLALITHGHAFADAVFVIQWHALGMFVPAFFTGHLIRRFGVLNVMSWGAVLLVISAGVAWANDAMINFWLAMTLLGVGWCFLFVGATTLLTETHSIAERAKTQALNEFMVFGTAAVTSFLSGSVHHSFGWATLNLVALPAVLAGLAATLWLARRRAGYKVGGTAD